MSILDKPILIDCIKMDKGGMSGEGRTCLRH